MSVRANVNRETVCRGNVCSRNCPFGELSFYISVVAPIAAILLGNIIILVMVTIRLHRSRKHKPTSNITRIITKARVAFACNLFFGSTWVLAFFAVEEVTMVFRGCSVLPILCKDFLSFFFTLCKIKK